MLGLFLSNWVFRKTVVDSIARAAGVLKQSKIDKFSQATMELLNYGVFAVVGMIIVPKQPWSWPSAQWWEGYTSLGSPDYPGPHSKMSQALCAYYILYASRYMANIFSVLMEHKRKDFLEMQLHHVVTVALVSVSYAPR